jgi:hypothetical protein
MVFDPRQDPTPVFEAALARSRATGKKVLVEYGGDWCGGAVRLDALLCRPEVASLIRRHFIHVRCHVGDDGRANSALIEHPVDMDAIPFFSLVDRDGRIVATQPTEPFELFWWYRKSKVIAFLQDWARR